jgi:hypothetical protein
MVKMTRLFAAAFAVVVSTAAFVGDGRAGQPDPRKAAALLVARLEADSKRAHVDTFAASKVVTRNGRLWLAFGSTPAGAPYMGGGAEPSQVRIYRWSGRAWRLDGTVSGELGPSQWINAASLTGSRDPDFAIQGCGAGDTNCLSVVSDIGGRWHAVPFEYGYGVTLEVNGLPAGHLVETEVDACSCAGGPSTWTYERYERGVFRPTAPPWRSLECNATSLTAAAYTWQVQIFNFDRVACAGGWALAVGTGNGFGSPVVGLFVDTAYHGPHWQVMTLDDGLSLPAAPAIYDLPLSLLGHLAARIGPPVVPQLAAARLIARLQTRYHFSWPQQNGIVRAAGMEWLIAEVPDGRAPSNSSAYPVVAVIYRWTGTSWAPVGRIRRPGHNLNVNWSGGWFVAVPAGSSSSVAFELVGACCTTTNAGVIENAHSTGLITNAGGTWHVVPR